MGVPAAVSQLHGQLQAAFKANKGDECESIAAQLKLELAKLRNPFLVAQQSKDELSVSRDCYEICAFVAVRKGNLDSFEKHVRQLKTLYRDYCKVLPPSSHEDTILGLQLLFLLSSDRIGEFHTELELIGREKQAKGGNLIGDTVILERYLMEGNYAKVYNAIQLDMGTSKGGGEKAVFLKKLETTMRRRIADSIVAGCGNQSTAAAAGGEKGSKLVSSSSSKAAALPAPFVAKMLHLGGSGSPEAQLKKFVQDETDAQAARVAEQLRKKAQGGAGAGLGGDVNMDDADMDADEAGGGKRGPGGNKAPEVGSVAQIPLWDVRNGLVYFVGGAGGDAIARSASMSVSSGDGAVGSEGAAHEAAYDTISNMIGYATELERIV